jgi:hypothetical protein
MFITPSPIGLPPVRRVERITDFSTLALAAQKSDGVRKLPTFPDLIHIYDLSGR